MSSTLGPWRLVAMWGFPRATLPTKAVTMSMYVTPVASSWTIWIAYTVATVGPVNVSGYLGSREASTGAREGESLSRQATTPLNLGGSATFGMGSRNSGDDVESYFSCVACLHSLALWCWALLPPALQLQHHHLNSPRVRGAFLAGIMV